MAIRYSEHHPGYDARYSPEKNVKKGHEKHRNYAHVFKELNALANLTHKESFRKAAELAHRKAIKEGDYERLCHACGQHHTSLKKKEAYA
jgi:hypothetical protein